MKLSLTVTRPLNHVPGIVSLLLGISLMLQCAWHSSRLSSDITIKDLDSPPETQFIRLAGLSDNNTIARFIMLWLQAFDNQPGVSLSLTELNYTHLTEWLGLILDLDAKMQYPLLAAARFYAEVPDPDRQRRMIEFIQQAFMRAPNQRWPAMAHAVYVAKHRMQDMQLAQECARLLRLNATGAHVPYWARQMEFFVLEDMGELEAAKILIGGLLESGELEDEQQRRFLGARLEELQEKIKESD